ncbi:transposase [Streptomyces sp. NPDC058000]|uniref:transposase n=1 Tax=Streptomyces sp. NPDC058000 TaxID=3346299 RepID=UPI0036E8A551
MYAYANGVRSSRKMERLCATDVAFKVICGLHGPDHTTIARIRADRLGLVEELFGEVLQLCARAGLGRLGEVALDGTKIAANASLQATHGREWFAKQARELLEEAERADAEEDAQFGSARGDELPAGLGRRVERLARLRRGIAEIEAEEATRAEATRQVGERTEELLRGGRLAGRAALRERRNMDRRIWLEVRLEAIGAQIDDREAGQVRHAMRVGHDQLLLRAGTVGFGDADGRRLPQLGEPHSARAEPAYRHRQTPLTPATRRRRASPRSAPARRRPNPRHGPPAAYRSRAAQDADDSR